jgi:hypothetical protein
LDLIIQQKNVKTGQWEEVNDSSFNGNLEKLNTVLSKLLGRRVTAEHLEKKYFEPNKKTGVPKIPLINGWEFDTINVQSALKTFGKTKRYITTAMIYFNVPLETQEQTNEPQVVWFVSELYKLFTEKEKRINRKNNGNKVTQHYRFAAANVS